MAAPNITFDSVLLADITARFDLRAPNAAALEATVSFLSTANGYAAGINDVATGVGKTFLMASLVEYAANQGIRNVLIVSPGSTIQNKTIGNFTPGHPKHVTGAEHEPFIITPENFQTGETGAALANSNLLKLFVFNVQQLLAPTQKVSRKVRETDENIGDSLYEHLRKAEDLIVLSDEHHIYSEKAKAFNKAIHDLNPMALIGVTATPSPHDKTPIIFQYSLGQAIADSFVKTPVIVYRRDGHKDERTQLADACHLLRAKEDAYTAYRENNPGKPATKPCLFVISPSITHAHEVATLLTQPEMIGESSAVLEVNSTSSDVALQALADVELESSPIRAIVSVDMLKEGWDVKRIAVIVALRRLASECLTEQILGRGLRLPFGSRTGIPAVDQVDLVAHDSYKKLLEQKDVLLQKVHIPDPVDTQETEKSPDSTGIGQATGDEGSSGQSSSHPNSETTPQGQPVLFGLGDPVVSGEEGQESDTSGAGSVGLKVQPFEETMTEAQRPAYVSSVPDSPKIVFPRLRAKIVIQRFSLSQVSRSEARLAGMRFVKEVPSFLFRDALDAHRDESTGEVTITRTPQEEATAAQQFVDISTVRFDLQNAIMHLREVQKELRERNGAVRIVNEFLTGAGVTESDKTAKWGEGRKTQALEGLRTLIRSAIGEQRQERTFELEPHKLPTEPVANVEALDAFNSEFQKFMAFTGWKRSIMPATKFDAKSTEWTLAHLMDRDPEIQWWLRLSVGDPAYIPMANGTNYYPDFVAIDTDGVHWLVEGKSNSEAKRPEVLAKRKAAEEWARLVNDDGKYATWRYLFVTEAHLKSAGSWQAVIYAANPD